MILLPLAFRIFQFFCCLFYDVLLLSDCTLLDIRLGVGLEKITKEGGGLIELIIRYWLGRNEEFQANSQTGKKMTNMKFEPSTYRTSFSSVTVARHSVILRFQEKEQLCNPLSYLGSQ
jgi:hypothetical protein